VSKEQSKKTIDWEAIQREYRAGILSVREIASMYQISHAAILKRAKKDPENWKRDLTKRIQAAVTRKLVTNMVTAADEDSVVEEAAGRALAIIKQHRKCIAKLDEAKAKMLKELHGNPTKLYLAQFQGRIISKKVGIAVTERASALLALAGVEERRIKLERQAFGITDDAKPDGEKITEIPLLFISGRSE